MVQNCSSTSFSTNRYDFRLIDLGRGKRLDQMETCLKIRHHDFFTCIITLFDLKWCYALHISSTRRHVWPTLTAEQDFKLKRMVDVIAFIADGGVENPRFFNCKERENDPNVDNPAKIDAYHFSCGSFYGYLAFFKGDKWIIKSFKKEPGGDPRNMAFAGLGEQFKSLPKKGKGE